MVRKRTWSILSKIKEIYAGVNVNIILNYTGTIIFHKEVKVYAG
jgi:hypothetical protein